MPGLKSPSQTRILQQNSLARHWARDWLALALTQVHHGSRLSDSCEGGEALSSVHPPTPATGKLIHNLLEKELYRIVPLTLSLKSLCGGGVPSSHPSLGLSWSTWSVCFLSFSLSVANRRNLG